MSCDQALLCSISSTLGYWSLVHLFPSQSLCVCVCVCVCVISPHAVCVCVCVSPFVTQYEKGAFKESSKRRSKAGTSGNPQRKVGAHRHAGIWAGLPLGQTQCASILVLVQMGMGHENHEL